LREAKKVRKGQELRGYDWRKRKDLNNVKDIGTADVQIGKVRTQHQSPIRLLVVCGAAIGAFREQQQVYLASSFIVDGADVE
jgi:hypothetical protein